MINKKITLHGSESQISLLERTVGVADSAATAFLSCQLKTLQGKLRRLEPLGFQVKTMQQCQSQQQRLQQVLSAFVDFLVTQIIKPFPNLFSESMLQLS